MRKANKTLRTVLLYYAELVWEWFRPKLPGVALIGGLILLVLGKYKIDTHFGQPIIGHFFEKPEYKAKYFAEVEPELSGKKFRVIADIHVGGEYYEEFYEDYDHWGNERTRSESSSYIKLERVLFPSGDTLTVRFQDESLRIDDPVYIEDLQGREWYVTLLDEPIKK